MGTRKAAERLRRSDGKLEVQQRRFDESGQSAVAFCRAEGIPISTFYQRRARLKKQGPEKRSSPSVESNQHKRVRPTRKPLLTWKVKTGLGVSVVVIRLQRLRGPRISEA